MGNDAVTAELAIRPYEDADSDAVRTLWNACRLIVPHSDPATDITFCRAAADAELFVGSEGGRLVATVMTGHGGWLYYLAVDPALRYRGLGGQMVAHAETWLGARGVAKVNLMIRDGNTDVAEFYEAVGYTCEPRGVMSRVLADKQG
ncbi:MAG: GNAT family acetyltransferase [Rhodospirillales bacterium]|jgi:ribosomal protein S18 acetylase RimI-like enzyme|nr:GNAT family acetyltransferase [Rhodospirillales bacterium]